MRKVVIICARNEESTVADVVSAAMAARVGQVLVVDDGSDDRTAQRAVGAGAQVIRGPAEGKGRAMLCGLEWFAELDVAIFLDADLVGLRPQHVIRLARLSEQFEHVVQLRDYGLPTVIARALPRISGERAVRAEILRHVPRRWWSGFLIEQAVNRVAARMSATEHAYVGRGVNHRLKVEKRGLVKGLVSDARMFGSIAAALATPLWKGGDEYPHIARPGWRPTWPSPAARGVA